VNIYIFVAAAVFSVLPIVVIYKVNLEKLIADPRSYDAVQKSFFIGAALSKIVTIILLIFGIIKMSPLQETSQLVLPVFIILVLIGYSTMYIMSKRKADYPEETKRVVKTLSTITLPHLYTVPIMALFFIILMI